MLVWEGDPFLLAANRRLVAVRQGAHAKAVQRATYRKAAEAMVGTFRSQWGGRLAIRGAARVTIVTYWARKRGPKRVAPGLGIGDVDATAKSVLDALQKAGVLLDDGQAFELVARKAHDPARPRIEVDVEGVGAG